MDYRACKITISLGSEGRAACRVQAVDKSGKLIALAWTELKGDKPSEFIERTFKDYDRVQAEKEFAGK